MPYLNELFIKLEATQKEIKDVIIATLSSPTKLTKVLHECGYMDNGINEVTNVVITDTVENKVQCIVDFLYLCEVEGTEETGQVHITRHNDKWSCEF